MRNLIAALLLAGLANTPAQADMTADTQAETMTCTTITEHADSDASNPWRTVNDGVMGGRSSGGSHLSGGVLEFAGETNTNGGGFSSIRMEVPRGAMAGADHLKVYMNRDARSYSLTLRTNVRSFGRRIAFRGSIEGAPAGEWGAGRLSFDQLKASIWGRPIPDAVFDPAEVVELGLIIYDGEDGPFSMQLKRIEACRS